MSVLPSVHIAAPTLTSRRVSRSRCPCSKTAMTFSSTALSPQLSNFEKQQVSVET